MNHSISQAICPILLEKFNDFIQKNNSTKWWALFVFHSLITELYELMRIDKN
jgi:hypothetical protein